MKIIIARYNCITWKTNFNFNLVCVTNFRKYLVSISFKIFYSSSEHLVYDLFFFFLFICLFIYFFFFFAFGRKQGYTRDEIKANAKKANRKWKTEWTQLQKLHCSFSLLRFRLLQETWETLLFELWQGVQMDAVSD